MEPFDTIDRLDAKDRLAEHDINALRHLTNQYPDVAELWSFLGDAIERSNESEIPAAEPFVCYQRAIECDTTYAPAHESAALFHDLFGELDRAEIHFRAALKHGASDSARVGLARVLAQQGLRHDAALEMSRCIDQDGEELKKLRQEIADGLWDPDNGEDAEHE